MFVDSEFKFSEDQDLASTATSIDSTNVVDLKAATKGDHTDVELVVLVTETFASAGDATLVIKLQSDTAEAMSSATTIIETPAIPKATLVAGYRVPYFLRLPPSAEQYLKLEYTIGTATTTAGKVSAFLAKDADSWADAFSA